MIVLHRRPLCKIGGGVFWAYIQNYMLPASEKDPPCLSIMLLPRALKSQHLTSEEVLGYHGLPPPKLTLSVTFIVTEIW